jgi:hypothetical protein
MQLHAIYREHQGRYNGADCQGQTDCWAGSYGEAIGAQPVSQEVWQRPGEGELKLNVDGAFVAQTLAGTGMIVRRGDGSVVFSACRVLWYCTSALEAELLGYLDWIRFATDMGLDHITVESDC